jgi:hypothetical protein
VRVLVVLAAAAFMLLAPAGSYAVHDIGLFELDGNTADLVAGGTLRLGVGLRLERQLRF